MVDPDSFEEMWKSITSLDPLDFKDAKEKYSLKLKKTMLRTNLSEAVLTGRARLQGREIVLCVFDVRTHEGGIECWLDTHLVEIRLRKRVRSEPPAHHAFAFELPKRALKRFPLLVAYDTHGKLVGVTIFRPAAGAGRTNTRKKSPEKRIRRTRRATRA